jgi:hypothetical protein
MTFGTVLVASAIVLSSTAATLPTAKLRCRLSNGEAAPNFSINIAAKTIVRGSSTYEITSLGETYITAFATGWNGIGGEVLVLNRITGDYQRASVSMVCNTFLNCGTTKLEMLKFTGKCQRPQL